MSDDIKTPQEMRRALQQLAGTGYSPGKPQHSLAAPIVRQCLDMQRYAGLSGEDTYTMMAWRLLQMAERYGAMVLQDAMLRVPQPFIVEKPRADQG